MSIPTSPAPGTESAPRDGFEVLDECHRQMVFHLGKLAALLSRLRSRAPDAEARHLAAEIVRFFSGTARQHHEDEERHVFPRLLRSGDPEIVEAVLRLKQDHGWLEEDWLELSPLLDAVAAGQSWYDLDVLHNAAEVFAALLRDHVALEEAFIYPEARARLQPDERLGMGREMAARRRKEKAANGSNSQS